MFGILCECRPSASAKVSARHFGTSAEVSGHTADMPKCARSKLSVQPVMLTAVYDANSVQDGPLKVSPRISLAALKVHNFVTYLSQVARL